MDEEKLPLSPEEAKEKEAERAEEDSGPAPEAARPGLDFGKVLFGLLTVAFGLYLLGKSLGWIPTDFYLDIFQFWPVLVVAAGLSLLDTRRLFSLLLALVALAAVAAFIGTAVQEAGWSRAGRPELPLRMDQEAEWGGSARIPGPVNGI